MLCEYCGRREATVQYIQIINGNRQELHLCSKCGSELGVDDFNMPIDLSNFFGEIFGDYNIPLLNTEKKLVCENCRTSFDEFLNTGKMGCANCYKTFEKKLIPILKRLQGGTEYLGDSNRDTTIGKLSLKEENKGKDQITILEEKLKKCIKDENYEEAAKFRDKIKAIKEEKNELNKEGGNK